jgi:hypothetical protein
MHLLPALACTAALCVASAAFAQTAVPLTRAEAEFAEPFSNIASVRELPDGRVLVADTRDRMLLVVDLAKGTGTPISREGSGPAEYGLPMFLWPMPRDTTYLFDPLNTRFLQIDPSGKATGTWSMVADEAVEGGGPRRMGLTIVQGVDGRGRFYSASPGIVRGPDGPRAADSTALTRYDRMSRATDTVAWVGLPKNNVQISGGRGNANVRIGGGNPFAPQDAWAVFPDGRVAVVRANAYHVDFYLPDGRHVRGPALRDDRVKVSEGHKEAWREQRRRSTPVMITMESGPGGTRRSAATPSTSSVPEPGEWPDVLPPFYARGAMAAPNGELWVRRYTPASEKRETWDVIDAGGRVTKRVLLPPEVRLVGMGRNSLYTARWDADDLQYLQRYRRP